MSAAYDQAFPETEVGAFEIKTLPAARLIASQTEATGEARGVFWNGSFMPGFFERFEVHITVRLAEE